MFTLNEIAKKVLNKGIVAKVIYDFKGRKNYVMLAQKKWLDVFGIETDFRDNDIIDAILEKKFELDKIEVLMIQYVEAPKNITLEDIVSPTPAFAKLGDNFLMHNKEYIKNISKALITTKLEFKDNLNYHISNYKNLNLEELKEIYYLRFFPLTVDNKNKEEILALIEKDVTERFFLHNEIGNTVSSIQTTIPALYKIGVSANQVDNTDARFIAALKRAWFLLIVEEREKILIELSSQLKALNNLQEEESVLNESRIQILEYIDLLKKINPYCLDSFKTVKEIISYWPLLMQPTPYYLYES